MSLAVFIGGTLALCGFLLWALIRASEAKGVMQEQARRASEDTSNAKKAGEVVAEHRSDNDTIDRLHNGKF